MGQVPMRKEPRLAGDRAVRLVPADLDLCSVLAVVGGMRERMGGNASDIKRAS